MKLDLGILALGLSLSAAACGGDARTIIAPPPESTAGVGGAGGAGGSPAVGGAGGETPLPSDAGPDASDAGGSGGFAGSSGAAGSGVDEPDGSNDPGAPVTLTIDPESIVIFGLPVNSTRFAAAGLDSATGICASIIWDYSNNGREVERHCDDIGAHFDFPYVVVREPPASCDNLEALGGFGLDELLQPGPGTGCFDALAESVNVQLEVYVAPTMYRIVMNNGR